jgi:PPOX class probable F420-dependent enzyme
MPKRRDLIRMTDDEMAAFIEEQKSLQFATINADGSPHLVTMWFAVVDGRIVIETFTKSQKIVNLDRDPRLAVLLEDGTVYNELRGVSIRGRAEIHKDPETVHELSVAVLRRNTPELGEDVIEKASRGMAAKKTAVVVIPEKTITWDHRKLGGVY